MPGPEDLRTRQLHELTVFALIERLERFDTLNSLDALLGLLLHGLVLAIGGSRDGRGLLSQLHLDLVDLDIDRLSKLCRLDVCIGLDALHLGCGDFAQPLLVLRADLLAGWQRSTRWPDRTRDPFR